MLNIEVLKFGSSVLKTAADLPVAVDEIYRRWRSGLRVIAVVSAFEGVTDRLMREAAVDLKAECPEAIAAYVSTGEQKTAALLLGALSQHGMPARLVEPREINLAVEGASLEATPTSIDHGKLKELWEQYSVLILPGFYGIDLLGRTALLGRGGSDLSALFLASEFKGACRLLKDVQGVFDVDPARSSVAHRFSALSWDRAITVAGPLIQSKALQYARDRGAPFEVGRPNDWLGTQVGAPADEWAPPTARARPLGVALLGCGVVGGGVYESLKRYPERFSVRHVVVREVANYAHVEEITADVESVLDPSVDVVVVCFGGTVLAYPLILAALNAGKFVVTANKAVIASHGAALASETQGPKRRLWYSAAVGGALPIVETLACLKSRVREVRGIINGTCGVVLEARSQGKTLEEAVAYAQKAGFAEENPERDLSGRDSADKLAIVVHSAFHEWLAPEAIATSGIDAITGDPSGYHLIARATRTAGGIIAQVRPETPPPSSFLGAARGAENRVEIELESGEVIRLRGQGAGRWPTAVSVLGDLLEIDRLHEMEQQQAEASSSGHMYFSYQAYSEGF
jgi:homoserine dehydrogenase